MFPSLRSNIISVSFVQRTWMGESEMALGGEKGVRTGREFPPSKYRLRENFPQVKSLTSRQTLGYVSTVDLTNF